MRVCVRVCVSVCVCVPVANSTRKTKAQRQYMRCSNATAYGCYLKLPRISAAEPPTGFTNQKSHNPRYPNLEGGLVSTRSQGCIPCMCSRHRKAVP